VLEKSNLVPATPGPECGILPNASVIHWVIKWGGESSLRLLRRRCSFRHGVRGHRTSLAESVSWPVSNLRHFSMCGAAACAPDALNCASSSRERRCIARRSPGKSCFARPRAGPRVCPRRE